MAAMDDAKTRIEAVRNYLGVPPVDDLFADPASHLSDSERINRVLYALYRTQEETRIHGCELGQSINGRLKKVEAWYYKAIGAGVALGMAGALTYLIIAIGEFLAGRRQ